MQICPIFFIIEEKQFRILLKFRQPYKALCSDYLQIFKKRSSSDSPLGKVADLPAGRQVSKLKSSIEELHLKLLQYCYML